MNQFLLPASALYFPLRATVPFVAPKRADLPAATKWLYVLISPSKVVAVASDLGSLAESQFEAFELLAPLAGDDGFIFEAGVPDLTIKVSPEDAKALISALRTLGEEALQITVTQGTVRALAGSEALRVGEAIEAIPAPLGAYRRLFARKFDHAGPVAVPAKYLSRFKEADLRRKTGDQVELEFAFSGPRSAVLVAYQNHFRALLQPPAA